MPGLTELMVKAARELEGQVDPQQTYQAAVSLAEREIGGCDAAALTIVERRKRLHSPAATHADAREADALQYELGEGPCIEATWNDPFVHSPELATDPRWSTWGQQVSSHFELRSLMAFRLFTDDHVLGALNLYSRSARGFDALDRDHGLALAAHIAVAARAAQQIDGLATALESRTVIGVALGMVMERFALTHDRAFAVLTRLSQHGNTRLRDVAQEIVDTRLIPS